MLAIASVSSIIAWSTTAYNHLCVCCVAQALEVHVVNLEEKLTSADERIAELEVECEQGDQLCAMLQNDYESLSDKLRGLADFKWSMEMKLQEVSTNDLSGGWASSADYHATKTIGTVT